MAREEHSYWDSDSRVELVPSDKHPSEDFPQRSVTWVLPENANPSRRPFRERFESFCSRAAAIINLAWILALSATVFFILTVTYTTHPAFAKLVGLPYGTPARSLFTLRVLSEATSLLLAGLIATVIEQIQWGLVVRPAGIRLLDYLALHSGTGIYGLLTLVTRRLSSPSTRFWSLLKLATIALIPILNVVLMSNVRTRVILQELDTPAPNTFGMTGLNSSLAGLWTPYVDLLYSNRFHQFATDPTLTVQLSASDKADGSGSYARTIYVPGGINSVNFGGVYRMTPVTEAYDDSQADVVLAHDQQGYVIEFRVNESSIRTSVAGNCHTYGIGVAAFSLCLRDDGVNTLHVSVTACPTPISEASSCLQNTTWTGNGDWSLSMKTYLRNATVAYNRHNGTITSYEFSEDPAKNSLVSAKDMFTVYDTFLKPYDNPLISSIAASADIDLGSRLSQFIWWYLSGVKNLSHAQPSAARQGDELLQALMLIPMMFCQPKSLTHYWNTAFVDIIASLGPVGQMIKALMPEIEPTTRVTLAKFQYEIVVGRAETAAYVTLGGVTLLVCITFLVMDALRGNEREIPKTTPFPVLDFLTQCKIEEAELDRSDMTASNDKYESDALRLAVGQRVKLLGKSKRGKRISHLYYEGC